MYVARRPFRNVGEMVSAGSVVEPADIRRFKNHLYLGHIIEVTEDQVPKWAAFFATRYGVDLLENIRLATSGGSVVEAVVTAVKVEAPVEAESIVAVEAVETAKTEDEAEPSVEAKVVEEPAVVEAQPVKPQVVKATPAKATPVKAAPTKATPAKAAPAKAKPKSSK